MSKVISNGETAVLELSEGRGTELLDRNGNKLREGDLVMFHNVPSGPIRLQIRRALFGRHGLYWALAVPDTDEVISGLPPELASSEYGVDLVPRKVE